MSNILFLKGRMEWWKMDGWKDGRMEGKSLEVWKGERGMEGRGWMFWVGFLNLSEPGFTGL